MSKSKRAWNRTEKLTVAGVIIAAVALLAIFIVPEVRRAIGLEKTPAPLAATVPETIKSAAPLPPSPEQRPQSVHHTKPKRAHRTDTSNNDVAGQGNVVGNDNVQINAPNGIGISGGTVINPSVYNFTQPQRTLTAQQRVVLVGLLQKSCPFEVAVRHSEGNDESQRYADQLADAIQQAGCKLRRPRFLVTMHETYGLWVTIHDAQNVPHGAEELRAAFQQAGIPVQGSTLDALQPGTIDLIVGLNDTKP